jgi:sec-independent protein translocase protein TatC
VNSGEPKRVMSFWEHLDELRSRLIRAAVAVVIAAGVAYAFREKIYDVLILPLLKAYPDITLNYFAPTEPFFIYLRIALFAGLVIASPVVLYQIWAFIAPGLTRRERVITLRMFIPVLLLFLGGVAFVYFFLLPISLKFLLGFAHARLEPELNQEKYFSFVTGLCLAGGILFELPAVLGLLGYLDLVEPRWLWKKTGYALVILMIVAAVITPTGDAFTMLALTAPLFMLYLLSILVVWVVRRGKQTQTT